MKEGEYVLRDHLKLVALTLVTNSLSPQPL